MPSIDLPIRAAIEVVEAHGIRPDRCEILQNSSTLVLRLTESLVARVVQDLDGPRNGTAWFGRENAIALHLSQHGAPVIPLHPDLPYGPHMHLGYPMNFWRFVTAIPRPPASAEIGRSLQECHAILQRFPDPLPKLAILIESLEILEKRELFPKPTQRMLCKQLTACIEMLGKFSHQALHGDAHMGNLLYTTTGLLWTDWEDTFSGPVEWDLASIIWNAQILDQDHAFAEHVLEAYRKNGGKIDPSALYYSTVARGAVMTVWYPILYPNPNPDRQSKLRRRIQWLEANYPVDKNLQLATPTPQTLS